MAFNFGKPFKKQTRLAIKNSHKGKVNIDKGNNEFRFAAQPCNSVYARINMLKCRVATESLCETCRDCVNGCQRVATAQFI